MKIEHNYNQRTRARLSVLIKQRQKKKEILGLEPTCLWLEGPCATTVPTAKWIKPNFCGARLVYSLMAGYSWRFGQRPGSPYQNVPYYSNLKYDVRFHELMSKFCPSLDLRFVHSRKKFERYIWSPDLVFAKWKLIIIRTKGHGQDCPY